MLARSGMTGPETSLDGKHGLFRQFTGDEAAAGRFRALIGGIGREWQLPNAAYKFYPCCHYLHPFIEAAGKLAERGVRPADVERIVCRVPQGEAAVICEPWERKQAPDNGHAARWSLPIAVAAQLVEGKIDLATFEAPASAAVRELAQRIAWEPLPGARFPERFEAEVVCKTKAETQTVRIDDVFGNHTRPPGSEAVLAKFRANAARSLKAGFGRSARACDARARRCPRPEGAVHGATPDQVTNAEMPSFSRRGNACFLVDRADGIDLEKCPYGGLSVRYRPKADIRGRRLRTPCGRAAPRPPWRALRIR